MAVLNIAGKSVTVDDSFLKMAPVQQNAAVDEIAKSIGIGATGSPPQTQAQAQPPQPMPQFIPGGEGIPSLSSTNPPSANVRKSDVLGTVDDYGRALANGMTFGLADRAAAGMGALTGVGGKQGDYSGNLAQQRAQTNNLPAAARTGLGLIGSAMVPIGAAGAAAKEATIGAKALIGSLTGGVLGGVQGAASSPDWTNAGQTAWDAGKGSLLGFGLGGALPVAGAGIGASYNKVADLFTGGVPGMSRAASNHLVSAVQADTPQAVQAAIDKYGPDAMLADAGPALLGKTQGAVLNSDAAKSKIVTALKQRDAGTVPRIMGDVEGALGPAEDPQTVTNAIKATRSAVDNTNFTKALGSAAPVDTTGVLAELGPAIGNSVGMENKALTNLRGMLMTEKPFPVIDRVTGKQMVSNGQPVTEMRTVPQDNPQILHKIKGELDNVIQYDAPGLGVPAGAVSRQQGALKQFRGALNDTLEQQVPGYAEANAASSALAKRGEAVEAGTHVLSSGKTTPSPERFASEFDQRQPGEQIAMAKGTRGDIARILGTKSNDLQALRGELQGEGGWNTAKLATMYGQDATDQLTGSVERNLKFRDTYNKVVENSQTAQRNAAANAMKPQPAGDMPIINPNMSITGTLATGAKKGVEAVINALRRDPTASYGDIAQVLSAQGPQRDAAFQAIKDAIAKRGQNSVMAPKVGDRAALVAAILANDQMRSRLQSQSR
jgi:hypothetical protein